MKWHRLPGVHAVVCPIRSRWRRRRYGQPFWQADKTAAMRQGLAALAELAEVQEKFNDLLHDVRWLRSRMDDPNARLDFIAHDADQVLNKDGRKPYPLPSVTPTPAPVSSGEESVCGGSVHSFALGGSAPCARPRGHEGDHRPGFIIHETTLPAPVSSGEAGESEAVRLSVNVHPEVAGALKVIAARDEVSVTEAVRRVIALRRLIDQERDDGRRVMVVAGTGDYATFRELILADPAPVVAPSADAAQVDGIAATLLDDGAEASSLPTDPGSDSPGAEGAE